MGALVLLSGSAPLAFITFLTATAYGALFVAFPLAGCKADLRARIEWLVLVWAIALGLSAIQWIPTIAWMLTLDRPWDALLAWPLPCQAPSSLEDLARQLLAPKEGMLPRVAYFGAVALTIASAAALVPRAMRREIGFFALASGLLFVFSVGAPSEWPSGDWTVRFPWLVCLFPGMLCLAVLFAMGLDRLLIAPQCSEVPRRAWPLALVVLGAWCFLFCVSPAEPRGRLLAVLLPLLLALALRRRRVLIVCGVVLLALLYIDMASSSLNRYQHPFQDAPGCYLRHGGALAKAEEQAMDARVYVSGQEFDYGLASNLGMVVPSLYGAGRPCAADQGTGCMVAASSGQRVGRRRPDRKRCGDATPDRRDGRPHSAGGYRFASLCGRMDTPRTQAARVARRALFAHGRPPPERPRQPPRVMHARSPTTMPGRACNGCPRGGP